MVTGPRRLPPVVLIALPGSRGDYRTLPFLYTIHSKKRALQGVVVCFEGTLSKKRDAVFCERERAWPPRSSLNQKHGISSNRPSSSSDALSVVTQSFMLWLLIFNEAEATPGKLEKQSCLHELVWAKGGLTDHLQPMQSNYLIITFWSTDNVVVLYMQEITMTHSKPNS